MSGPVWKRSWDEALALGGSLSNVKGSKGNNEDYEDEENPIKKKRVLKKMVRV